MDPLHAGFMNLKSGETYFSGRGAQGRPVTTWNSAIEKQKGLPLKTGHNVYCTAVVDHLAPYSEKVVDHLERRLWIISHHTAACISKRPPKQDALIAS